MTGKTQDLVSQQQAFETMRQFLINYWNRGDRRSEDIAILLGEINTNNGKAGGPFDASQWSDWLTAFRELQNRDAGDSVDAGDSGFNQE